MSGVAAAVIRLGLTAAELHLHEAVPSLLVVALCCLELHHVWQACSTLFAAIRPGPGKWAAPAQARCVCVAADYQGVGPLPEL